MFMRQAYQFGNGNMASTSALSAMAPRANLEREKRKNLIICGKFSAAAEPAHAWLKINSRAAFAQLPQELIR